MKPVLALVFSLWALTSSEAQVTARQGEPAPSPFQQFESPMILDLPLLDLQSLPFGTGFTFKEVTRFYCEDVVLSQLVVAKRKESHRGKPDGLRIDVRGTVTVRPSFDRWTNLRFDLVRGEEKIAFTAISRLSTEEGRTTPFKSYIKLDAAQVERLYSPGAPGDSTPTLRVTVTVADNN